MFYLDNFATKSDFEWQQECCGDKTLELAKARMRGVANNPSLIQAQFDNVFNEKHHIYKVKVRTDGQVVRSAI